ncbi:hypothetical protein PF004_g20804 [Phytophthora fragariae]|uniref:Uncharacterized protein n=1 Tax=Phytophthora fragariae TaxID=53985 RepID=A0A6G0N5Q6_9STRA|nr:hypothetical protein PF004_g20804 [Phytophthora fragariae]
MGHTKRDCLDPNADNDDDAGFAVGKGWSTGWMIGSGATVHMTPHRNDLFEYKNLESNLEMTIADGKKIRALLSVGKLAERGMSVEFQQKSCAIWNKLKAIALSKTVGKPYVFDCEKDMAHCVEYASRQ